MQDAGPPAAAAAAAGVGGTATGGDWRTQINSMARKVMAKQIMKTLRWHLPMSDPEGLSRLQSIADGFEQRFYDEATSKTSYSRKIAMLLIYVENINQNPHRQENGADDKGKAPMSESPGDDEVIPLPQESSDSTLYATSNEDLTYEPTDGGSINLKKRKFDSSSSWALLLGQHAFAVPVDDPWSSSSPPFGQPTSSALVDDPSSFQAILEASSSVPSWANLQFKEWEYDN